MSELFLAITANDSVEDFENAFARMSQTKHAFAFPYGRTALLCLLEAMGISDSQVLCPSYTCVVVPHAITYSANEPVFVDCRQDSFLMDLELAAKAANELPKPRALIATSLFGEPVSHASLEAFSAQCPDVDIIQDCAHSFLCQDAGRPVHKHGLAAIFGLNFSKIITSVFGGMVTTDDDDLAVALREVRATRISPASLKKSITRRMYYIAARLSLWPPLFGGVQFLSRYRIIDRFVRYYSETKIDMPRDYLEGLSHFEAAIGIRQCARYHEVISHRRMIAARYQEALKDCSHLYLPTSKVGHTFSHYTLKTDYAEHYVKKLHQRSVELGTLIEYCIPLLDAYRNHRFYANGQSQALVGKTLNLPVHLGVTPDLADQIILLLKEIPTHGYA